MSRFAPFILLSVLTASGCLPRRAPDASAVKIVNGTAVDTSSAVMKWTAALTKPNGQMLCTAVQVTPTVLLTAAHCLTPAYVADGMNVVLGPSIKEGTATPMVSFRQHPGFDPTAKDKTGKAPNDLGVVIIGTSNDASLPPIVATDTQISPFVTPITLAGFGTTKSTGGTAGRLLQTTTMLSTDANSTNEAFMDSLSVRNACHGDSGGPALLGNEQDGYQLLGIASYVIDVGGVTCESGLSSYTDLRKFGDFLSQYLGN